MKGKKTIKEMEEEARALINEINKKTHGVFLNIFRKIPCGFDCEVYAFDDVDDAYENMTRKQFMQFYLSKLKLLLEKNIK